MKNQVCRVVVASSKTWQNIHCVSIHNTMRSPRTYWLYALPSRVHYLAEKPSTVGKVGPGQKLSLTFDPPLVLPPDYALVAVSYGGVRYTAETADYPLPS